jgi:hypothetical protein
MSNAVRRRISVSSAASALVAGPPPGPLLPLLQRGPVQRRLRPQRIAVQRLRQRGVAGQVDELFQLARERLGPVVAALHHPAALGHHELAVEVLPHHPPVEVERPAGHLLETAAQGRDVVGRHGEVARDDAVPAVEALGLEPRHELVEPHRESLVDGRAVQRRELRLNAPYGEESLVVARTELRDSMGLRWRRDHNGRPHRLLADY